MVGTVNKELRVVNKRKYMDFQKGEITVFLSLTLIIMISVLFTVIESARSNTCSFQTECVTDMALQSSLAEYNRGLLEQYDLFFVDAGYGTGEKGYILLEEHIRDYMQENFEIEGISLTGFIRDMFGMEVEDAAVIKASGAADKDGIVLERAAVDYMLDMANLYDTSKLSSYAAMAEEMERDDTEDRFNEVEKELSDFDDDENPAGNINKIRRSSSKMLKTVTEGREISGVGINQAAYISVKGHGEKNGFILGEKDPSLAEDLIFQKYLMDKCGNYTREKENSLLKYQMEYVLKGKDNDEDNLKEVVKNLLVIREAANFAHIIGDRDKLDKVEFLTATNVIVLLVPELYEVVKMAIILGWSYGESLNDVRILLKGGKIPPIKDRDSWELGLLEALLVNLHGEGSSEGMDYDDYLHVLLAVLNKETRNLRFMDVVEMDIRQLPGNQGFAMENCLNAYTVTITTNSSKGDSNMITRVAGFKK